MLQLSIEDAISAGQSAAQACTERAEDIGFSTEAARDFVLAQLAHSSQWGEDLVDAATATRRPELQAHDGRAWGSVFSSLARVNRIRCIELGMRRKGNGTAGARRWSAVQ